MVLPTSSLEVVATSLDVVERGDEGGTSVVVGV